MKIKIKKFEFDINLKRLLKDFVLVLLLVPLIILASYNKYSMPCYGLGRTVELERYTVKVDLDSEHNRFICDMKKAKNYNGIMQFSCESSYYSEENENYISFRSAEYFEYETKSGNFVHFSNNMYYFNGDETFYISYDSAPEDYKLEIANRTDNVTLSILGLQFKLDRAIEA